MKPNLEWIAIVAVSFAFYSATTFAQSEELTPDAVLLEEEPAAETQNAAVYNFDADVILGDKKTPDVLFQSGADMVGFDALLLDRKDFNDFLRIDRRRFPDRVE